jgi:3-oxoacyl-[acyl-carrier-protein] synthase-3
MDISSAVVRTRAGAANARTGLGWTSEIAATAYAYPRLVVDNEAFLRACRFPVADDVVALIRETRMETRRWCADDENTWTLARQAIWQLLESAPELCEEVDLVVVASGTTMPVVHAPDPGNAGVADLAPLVLREIGRERALGLDIKACYCTGFLRGLQVADGMLGNASYRAALVIATEQGSRFATAETNRSSFCFIMADAAGAALLRRRDGRLPGVGIVDHVGWTDAGKFEWVGIGPDAASTVMRGSRAGAATHAMLVECAQTLMSRNGLRPADIDWLLPIQTHAGVIAGVREELGFPAEKLLWFGGATGFSGSASIPACLAEQVERGTIARGQLVLSIAVGAGMNCAGVLYYS